MSKPNLQGHALTTIQYNLYAATCWLDEFKNGIAVRNVDTIGLNT